MNFFLLGLMAVVSLSIFVHSPELSASELYFCQPEKARFNVTINYNEKKDLFTAIYGGRPGKAQPIPVVQERIARFRFEQDKSLKKIMKDSGMTLTSFVSATAYLVTDNEEEGRTGLIIFKGGAGEGPVGMSFFYGKNDIRKTDYAVKCVK